MRRRTAGKTNRQFWGCPAYPNCKGTQDIEA
jgi:ssDNA-binding Zn-finger/Zn-ribbon topoisomerase 1